MPHHAALPPRYDVPPDFDLLTIDTDYNDYWTLGSSIFSRPFPVRIDENRAEDLASLTDRWHFQTTRPSVAVWVWLGSVEIRSLSCSEVVAVDFNPDLPLNEAKAVRRNCRARAKGVDEEETKSDAARAIQSIPAYVESSSIFLALVPAVKDPDNSAVRDYTSWLSRGWCRAELWCHLLSNKKDTRVIVVHSSKAGTSFLSTSQLAIVSRTCRPSKEAKFMFPMDWQYNLVCDGEFTVEEDREVVVRLGDRAVEHKIRKNAMLCAMFSSDLPMLRLLAEHKADVNMRMKGLGSLGYYDSQTLLMATAKSRQERPSHKQNSSWIVQELPTVGWVVKTMPEGEADPGEGAAPKASANAQGEPSPKRSELPGLIDGDATRTQARPHVNIALTDPAPAESQNLRETARPGSDKARAVELSDMSRIGCVLEALLRSGSRFDAFVIYAMGSGQQAKPSATRAAVISRALQAQKESFASRGFANAGVLEGHGIQLFLPDREAELHPKRVQSKVRLMVPHKDCHGKSLGHFVSIDQKSNTSITVSQYFNLFHNVFHNVSCQEASMSCGSYGHPELCASPCIRAFYSKCTKGFLCEFCHLGHTKPKCKLNKKERQLFESLDESEVLSLVFSLLKEKCEKLPDDAYDALRLVLATIQRRVNFLGEASPRKARAMLVPLQRFSLGRCFEVLQHCQQIDGNFKEEVKRLVMSARTAVHKLEVR
eukprot:Skav221792  [mRNA]  locus=scaffold4067:129151:162908:- [translate_table: standard]